jgi:hypothetical protein
VLQAGILTSNEIWFKVIEYKENFYPLPGPYFSYLVPHSSQLRHSTGFAPDFPQVKQADLIWAGLPDNLN